MFDADFKNGDGSNLEYFEIPYRRGASYRSFIMQNSALVHLLPGKLEVFNIVQRDSIISRYYCRKL